MTVSSNGSYTYTPNANFNGTDSFTFPVSEVNASSKTETQTMPVTAFDCAPWSPNGIWQLAAITYQRGLMNSNFSTVVATTHYSIVMCV